MEFKKIKKYVDLASWYEITVCKGSWSREKKYENGGKIALMMEQASQHTL